MVYIKVSCPHRGSDNVVLHGKNANGKQRFLCRNSECSRKTFLLEYDYNACKPSVKQQIADMAQNGSGTRDTGRFKRHGDCRVKKNGKISAQVNKLDSNQQIAIRIKNASGLKLTKYGVPLVNVFRTLKYKY